MGTHGRRALSADLSASIEVTHRRPGRVRALLALGTVLGIAVVGTTAAFSDSAAVAAEFTAGTLDITVDGQQGNPTPYVVSFVGADAMAPGDTVFAPLRVANVGSVDADLSLDVEATPDGTVPNVTTQLQLTIVHTTGTACNAGVVTADADPYIATGAIDGATFTGVDLDGGDGVDLCLAVELPASVTGTGGGASDVLLTFVADQAGS